MWKERREAGEIRTKARRQREKGWDPKEEAMHEDKDGRNSEEHNEKQGVRNKTEQAPSDLT
jgi:hypothetical protein